ncbi:MAG: 5-formyltetrahydrofolate cyclo-ligase [Verrucomicrobiota bacterium]
MSVPLANTKAALREQIRARLKSISAAQRVVQSVQTCELLKKQFVWEKAKVILFYAPLPNEVDIWPLVSEVLAADKIVALPGFDAEENSYVARQIESLETDLDRGQFGIREPKLDCREVLLNRLDLTLVPGVGFDFTGRRLGRGKGFYDRLLAQISGTTCGVGFDEQIVETIPTEPHDVHLNCILTPTRWHEVTV